MTSLSKSAKIFLFAVYLTETHKIMGKVNLNKIMAYLERNGFIIEPKFFEKPMGSCLSDYSFIDDCTSSGFIIEQNCVMPNGYAPRQDYSLSNKGIEEVSKLFTEIDDDVITNLKTKINDINIKIGKEASKQEHEELLYEVENTDLKAKYFEARKDKITQIYSKLKTEYETINPDLKDLELMDKKGILEYVLVVLNKIKKLYYEDLENEVYLTDNTMGQYYLIKLGEIFLKQYEENNQNYIRTYNIFKEITQKYNIFPPLDKLTDNDLLFFKLNKNEGDMQ